MTDVDRSSIFVVYGRNTDLRDTMFRLLRALGLNPRTWPELMAHDAPATHTFEIIDSGIRSSFAVVALLSDDEEVTLRAPFYNAGSDEENERESHSQARPNVFLEAGMALALKFDKTFLVRFGDHREISDLKGLNYFQLSGKIAADHAFVKALKSAKCPVRINTSKLQAINFRDALPKASEIPASEAFCFTLTDGTCQYAHNLAEFRDIVKRLDYEIFRTYLRAGDYENWFDQSFHDRRLAADAKAAREQDARPGGNGRQVLLRQIARRYRP